MGHNGNEATDIFFPFADNSRDGNITLKEKRECRQTTVERKVDHTEEAS
jgi:hypothetical protein